MRLFFFILYFLIASNVLSQNGKGNLEFVDASLQDVLLALEEKYNVLISYENLKQLEENLNGEKINFSSTAESRQEFLSDLFETLNLTYNFIDDDQLVIKEKEHFKELLCGQVIDELSGDPLAFANVIAQDSSFGTSANEEGIFLLPEKIENKKDFTASYVGFQKMNFNSGELGKCKVDQNNVVSPESKPKKIGVQTPTFNVPYLIIRDYLTDGIDLKDNGLSTSIKPRFIGTLPGQVEPDILHSIQFLPGISSPSSKSSDIYIRGGTPDQSLILWEDIPLYHSAHYFGVISAIDPYVVSEMKVFRGGFDASYGGRASGVVDIKSHGVENKNTFIGFGSNMVCSHIDGHQIIGEDNRTSLTFSLRRSFTEFWETPTYKNYSILNQQGLVLGDQELFSSSENIDISNDFNFLDSHIKFESQIGKKTKLSGAGIYASNIFNGEINDDSEDLNQLDSLALSNKGASLKLLHQWSEKLESSLKFIGTEYSYDYNFEVLDVDRDEEEIDGLKSNQIVDQEVHLSTKYELKNEQYFELGYQWTRYDISFETEKISKKYRDVIDKGSTQSMLHSTFLTYKNPIQNKLGLDLGLRLNYFLETKGLNFEPRIKLSYQISDYLSGHANYGRHHQYIGQITDFRGSDFGISTPLWALAENKSIPIQKANQGQIGLIFNKSDWVVDLQAYSKIIQGLSSRSYDFENTEGNNQSRGDAIINGIDLFVKKRLNKDVKVWASYTYSQINMRFPEISNDMFPSDFDQRHNLQCATQIKLKNIQIASGIKYSSGLPYTDIRSYDLPSQMSQNDEFEIRYDDINSENLNNLFELNVSMNYTFKLNSPSKKAILGFSFMNLLNNVNTYSRTAYVKTPRNQMPSIAFLDRVNLPTTFNLSIRFEI